MENHTNFRFVSIYKRCNIEYTIKIYSCFRNGVYKPKGTGKRNLKSQSTNKIANICKAKIKAKFYRNGKKLIEFLFRFHFHGINDTEKVVVDFHPVHQGHGEDIGHLFLRPRDKSIVAQKLSMGIDFLNVIYSKFLHRRHLYMNVLRVCFSSKYL